MSEEPTEQDITQQKPNSNSSLWSPWAVLFLGVWFGALNWWRMGNKRKAMAFLLTAALINLFNEWIAQRNYFPADLQLWMVVLIVQIVVGVAFWVLLVDFVRINMREFQFSGKQPVPTHWTIIFKFLLITTVLPITINYTLYYLPAIYGYCGFPRLQKIVYQVQVINRAGLEKVFLSRNDFGCDWYWTIEDSHIEEITETTQTSFYHLVGYYRSVTHRDSSMFMTEMVYKLAEPVTKERFAQFLADGKTGYSAESAWSVMDISEYDLQQLLSEARCRNVYGEKICTIYLADESLIVRLVVRWHGDPKLNEIVKQITQTTAQRMLAYNQSP